MPGVTTVLHIRSFRFILPSAGPASADFGAAEIGRRERCTTAKAARSPVGRRPTESMTMAKSLRWHRRMSFNSAPTADLSMNLHMRQLFSMGMPGE